MRRRVGFLIIAAALASLAAPASGQTPEKIYRLAVLSPSPASIGMIRSETLAELGKAGFAAGRNLTVEARTGPPDALPRLAEELVALEPDAIVAVSSAAIRAAQHATTTVPIVVFGGELSVALRGPISLHRPGGNVTGVVILGAELDGKRLDLLHQALGPTARRIAGLLLSSAPNRDRNEAQMRAAASSIGLEFLPFDVVGPDDYPAVFSAMRAAGADGLVIMATPRFLLDAAPLAALALGARLPTSCEWTEMVEQGCLLGYGPNRAQLYRELAGYLTRIFKGARPGELPIAQPDRFEFAVNLRTARALGIELPPSILARADEVIE